MWRKHYNTSKSCVQLEDNEGKEDNCGEYVVGVLILLFVLLLLSGKGSLDRSGIEEELDSRRVRDPEKT